MNSAQLVLTLSVAMACAGAALIAWGTQTPTILQSYSKKFARAQAFKIADYSGISIRLKQLERNQSYLDFRTEQLLSATTGFIAGFSALFLISGHLFLALCVGGGIACGVFLSMDFSLTRTLEKVRTELEAEFPAVIEMMSLALSAGETPAQAMHRVAERSTGLMAQQFSMSVEAIRRGTPFHIALDDMGRRINSLVIRRFIDAMVTAVVRGAPLVDVLQRHAMESRQSYRNAVMAKAGKAEISMMIPIVFLILPISILFALWPSLSTLNLFST